MSLKDNFQSCSVFAMNKNVHGEIQKIDDCTVYTGAVQYGLAVSLNKALNISGAYMLGEKKKPWRFQNKYRCK